MSLKAFANSYAGHLAATIAIFSGALTLVVVSVVMSNKVANDNNINLQQSQLSVNNTLYPSSTGYFFDTGSSMTDTGIDSSTGDDISSTASGPPPEYTPETPTFDGARSSGGGYQFDSNPSGPALTSVDLSASAGRDVNYKITYSKGGDTVVLFTPTRGITPAYNLQDSNTILRQAVSYKLTYQQCYYYSGQPSYTFAGVTYSSWSCFSSLVITASDGRTLTMLGGTGGLRTLLNGVETNNFWPPVSPEWVAAQQ